jgi:hypothetical protein
VRSHAACESRVGGHHAKALRRLVSGDERRDVVIRASGPLRRAKRTSTRRTRSAITLAILTTLRAEEEVAMHVRAAPRNGLTPEEIREVRLHTAVYAGVPAADTEFAIAQRVLEEDAG